MSSRAPSLSPIRKNKWGNYCYKEDSKMPTVNPNTKQIDGSQLLDDVVWTIEDPSPDCIAYFPSAMTRDYNGRLFLLSKKALEYLPKETNITGEVTVVETDIDGKRFFVMVSDNKPYIMNAGGGSEEGESQIKGKCAVRELEEETKISVDVNELKEIARWEFTERNELCGEDYEKKLTTTAFYVFLPQNRIAHLIPARGLNVDGITVVDIKKDIPLDLNETTYVYFVPKANLEFLPTKVENKSFDGHHRELLNRLSGVGTPVNTFTYLRSFTYL